MKTIVVGTAGHVDHGKTSLIRALTGTDCDRLPEEKRRGISIELGFARWSLGDNLIASVVDVPGHERFVRTMVAGASGVDVILLVVAADDGVMPQTREHLAICELLGVSCGVVVITKVDAVDSDLLELVREDIATLVQGTFLQDASVIPCSAVTGEGLSTLSQAVLAVALSATSRMVDGPVFLPIDRLFSVHGFGTVVTGTLLCGTLSVGSLLDALPGPQATPSTGLKVRGLHVHDHSVERATAGQRVAVNLRGDGLEKVKRGDTLATEGWLLPTFVLTVEVRLLVGVKPLPRRSELSLHIGTAQIVTRGILLEGDSLVAGESALVRLLCEEAVAAFVGERFVLRRAEPDGWITIGGGVVCDPYPRIYRRNSRNFSSPFFRKGTPRERALALVREGRERGVALSEACRRLSPESPTRELLEGLVKKGHLASLLGEDPTFVDISWIHEVENLLLKYIQKFHIERPLLSGAPTAEIVSCLPVLLVKWGPLALQHLVQYRKVVEEGGIVRLVEHDPGVSAALEHLRRLYENAGLTPPSEEEARRAVHLTESGFRDAMSELRRRGQIKVSGGIYFATAVVDALKKKIASHFRSTTELSAPTFKELAGGISRKYAIPLLELLDAESFTRRKGDVRVAGPGINK